MITVAVYDTKPYDTVSLSHGTPEGAIHWRFLDFRLTEESAASAAGARAVCVFVSDRIDRPCLEALARLGVKLVALRCTGFNNVDIEAARELGIAVTRVAVYSPLRGGRARGNAAHGAEPEDSPRLQPRA